MSKKTADVIMDYPDIYSAVASWTLLRPAPPKHAVIEKIKDANTPVIQDLGEIRE